MGAAHEQHKYEKTTPEESPTERGVGLSVNRKHGALDHASF